jgi:hypothetical protein
VDPENSFYSSTNGVLFDKSQATLLQYPDVLGGNYTIPGSVTSIANYAFNECTNLTSVTIPASITSIGANAFLDCTSLSAITVEPLNSVYSSVAGVLFDKSQTTLIVCPVGNAGSYTIPNGVTSIESNAFLDCASLTSVTIPGSVTNIGDSAFYECASLTNATIANGVTSIGEGAFACCSSLTSVTIPGSVTNLGDAVFYGCYNLTSVYFTGNAPNYNSSVFSIYRYDYDMTTYYLAGTTGWSVGFWGWPWSRGPQALLWDPFGPSGEASFGVQSNQFGFNFTGPLDLAIVVEVCTNLANSVWTPLQTNTLSNGSFYFSEPLQTSSLGRFYRISSP